MKLEFNYKKKDGTNANTCRPNSMPLKHKRSWRNQKENHKLPSGKWKQKHSLPKIYGMPQLHQKDSIQEGIQAIQGYPKKQEKYQLKNLNSYLKKFEKKNKQSPKSSEERKS